MVKEILVDAGPDKVRVAILEDGEPVEIFAEETGNKSLVGNIYRGKVERTLKGMQAAFVDIGLERNAFLYVNDIVPVNFDEHLTVGKTKDISELISPGQEISVQITKDASENKGARVTTRLSLPGRYLAIVRNTESVGVSKKISDEKERERLRDIARRNKPENAGIIIRTAAEGIPEEQIAEEIEELKKLYHTLLEKEKKGNVPRLLYSEPGIIGQAVREHLTADTRRFIINNESEYERILAFLEDTSPALKNKIQLYSKEYDMFEFYNVESAINEALSRKVRMKSGAYLIFDMTEALTVIDVNSGQFTGKTNLEDTAFRINLEAAQTIARQLRLRNLSGIIIVDFIDMHNKEHQQQVVQTLKDAVKSDKTHTVVIGMTSLGLVEITRKKIRQPLYKSFTISCHVCNGTGFIRNSK